MASIQHLVEAVYVCCWLLLLVVMGDSRSGVMMFVKSKCELMMMDKRAHNWREVGETTNRNPVRPSHLTYNRTEDF